MTSCLGYRKCWNRWPKKRIFRR